MVRDRGHVHGWDWFLQLTAGRFQHALRAALVLFPANSQFDGEFAKLFIVALKEIADQRDQRRTQNQQQAYEDL